MELRSRTRAAGAAVGPPARAEPDRAEVVARQVLDVVPPLVVFAAATAGLLSYDVHTTVHNDPRVDRAFLGAGIFASSLVVLVKIYLEGYKTGLLKETVNYETMPHTTHAAMGLMLVSGFTLLRALWPAWRQKTLVVMGVFSCGFLFPIALSFPSPVQNTLFLVFWSWEALMYAGFMDDV